MEAIKKVLIITRHGKSPQKPIGVGSLDELFPDSVTSLFLNTGVPLQQFVIEYGVNPWDSFLRHSGRERTLYTGQAILAGALRLEPKIGENPPRSQEDLENYPYDGIAIQADPRLGYDDVLLNDKPVEDGMGVSEYLQRWVDDPNAETFEGAPITSFNDVLQTGKANLVGALVNLIHGNKDLGVLATHALLVEPIVMTATNLTGPGSLDRIGGLFDMEEHARITIEKNLGGPYRARLQRGDKFYATVDLDTLLKK